MNEVIERAENGELVLDLGCGGGSLDYRNHTRLKIFPADKSFRLKAETPAGIKARFVRADSASLPYKEGSFDVCLSNFVVEHVNRPIEMLTEVNRVLKPQGFFYVSIPNCRSLEDRLYRRLSPDHCQQFTFKSFIELVYLNTSFKLISFCNWPGGFNYLTGAYAKYQIPLFHLLKAINGLFRRNLLSESNYLFLFRKDTNKGLRFMDAVCRKCGGGHQYEQAGRHWVCRNCGTENLTV